MPCLPEASGGVQPPRRSLSVCGIAAVSGATSSHPHQISTAIMIRNGIVKAVLVFYSKALVYKAFLCF